jgi:glycerophosphoryl diester phosphodiesterase
MLKVLPPTLPPCEPIESAIEQIHITEETQITTKLLENQLHILQKKYKFRVEGHRGAGLLELENTLLAFKRAIAIGLDGIELDIWPTKDGIPVVIHGKSDRTVEFVGLTETIENLTYHELCQLKLMNGERIPTLREVLELSKNNICINIELKGDNLRVIQPTILILEELNMWGQINFSSFYHVYHQEIIRVMQSRNLQHHKIYFGYLMKKLESYPDLSIAEENDSLNMDYQLLIHHKEGAIRCIEQARNKKMKIKIYFPMKIKENHDMYKELIGLEVDTIITNYPLEIMNFLMTSHKDESAVKQKADKEIIKRIVREYGNRTSSFLKWSYLIGLGQLMSFFMIITPMLNRV